MCPRNWATLIRVNCKFLISKFVIYFKELHMSREDALSAQEGGWRLVAISPPHPTLCLHLLNRDGGNKTDKNKKKKKKWNV